MEADERVAKLQRLLAAQKEKERKETVMKSIHVKTHGHTWKKNLGFLKQ